MQFKNLTPFDAMAYSTFDTKDREYNAVVLCASYNLIPVDDTALELNSRQHIQQIYQAEVVDEDVISLCLADEFYDEPNLSSIKQESDLAPYKPKCDVLIHGHAYAQKPTSAFAASFKLLKESELLIDKELWFTGHQQLVRENKSEKVIASNLASLYRLTAAKPVDKVPLRYEYALGGSCTIQDPNDTENFLVNEVCYKNPIGCGWMSQEYLDLIEKVGRSLPMTLPSPQIMPAQTLFKQPLVTKQSGSMDAKKMATIQYLGAAGGFSAIHRSWAPRLAKAGTYDDVWLKERHPYLPLDFDFDYWNGAPEDQQIDFPDLTVAHTCLINNLSLKGGLNAINLPKHRALVLLKKEGLSIPIPMQVDTIIYHTDDLTLKLVWRMAILKDFEAEVMEARFITDPDAPWLTFED